jgi:hypothetical protein
MTFIFLKDVEENKNIFRRIIRNHFSIFKVLMFHLEIIQTIIVGFYFSQMDVQELEMFTSIIYLLWSQEKLGLMQLDLNGIDKKVLDDLVRNGGTVSIGQTMDDIDEIFIQSATE